MKKKKVCSQFMYIIDKFIELEFYNKSVINKEYLNILIKKGRNHKKYSFQKKLDMYIEKGLDIYYDENEDNIILYKKMSSNSLNLSFHQAKGVIFSIY